MVNTDQTTEPSRELERVEPRVKAVNITLNLSRREKTLLKPFTALFRCDGDTLHDRIPPRVNRGLLGRHDGRESQLHGQLPSSSPSYARSVIMGTVDSNRSQRA
jgi:hypothetical protein